MSQKYLSTMDAVETLRQRIPDRHYVTAQKEQCWDEKRGYFVRYQVCLQPGLDGTECSIFYGETAECAVAAAIAFDPNTKNDE